MIKENTFKKWLIEEKQYNEYSARDVLSRCRRVEKVFNIKLSKTVKSINGYNNIRQRLLDEFHRYIKPGANTKKSVSAIVTAIKVYHNFLYS